MLTPNKIKIDGHELDEVETKSYNEFVEAHKGHRIIKIAKGNGIGINFYMLCVNCEKWKDIANVNNW